MRQVTLVVTLLARTAPAKASEETYRAVSREGLRQLAAQAKAAIMTHRFGKRRPSY
jgi:hypothetical protein